LAVGLVLGLPLALTVVVKVLGAASLGAVDWAAVLSGLAGAVPAALLALLVAAVWLAPLVLLIMAASAWLKRLGIPALVVAAIALYNLPLTRGAVRPLWNAYGAGIEQIMQGAIGVFLTSSLPNLKIDGDGLAGVEMSLAQFLAKLGFDAGFALVRAVPADCSGLLLGLGGTAASGRLKPAAARGRPMRAASGQVRRQPMEGRRCAPLVARALQVLGGLCDRAAPDLGIG
jgi:hypothetical protein